MIRHFRPPRAMAAGLLAVSLVLVPARAAEVYYPGPGELWEKRGADAVGMDAKGLARAGKFAQDHEASWLRDVRAQIERDVAHEPYSQLLGETSERGGPSGIILRHGYIVAEWGDADRVDMSFGVAQSYLSALAGLALDRGLIKDISDPVWKYVRDGGFDSAHNTPINWHMLLNQTSEWEGVVWGKPDLADRRRGYARDLQAPGTFWEYNDVRVDRLALSLLHVWRRPLWQVLREQIMDPIGASRSWVWRGYRNSFVDIDGRAMESVSGGSHWGGGLWASARDHARFGYLFLRGGNWNGRQVLSKRWIQMATRPSDIAPQYGYLWWLNTARKTLPAAPESSYFAFGSGGNMIWVEPDHDLVVVARWLDFAQLNAFASLVEEAIISKQ